MEFVLEGCCFRNGFSQIKKRALHQVVQTSKTLKIHYEKLILISQNCGSNRIRTCDPLLVRQVL